jgi:plastocyanin
MPVAVLLALLSAAPESGAIAGTVTVRRAGAQAAGASVVVYVVGFHEPAPPEAAEIRQRDKHFDPDLLAITAGQTVSFPNGDPFFHNVFSVSAVRKFDLGQYPRGDTKTKQFPAVGVVDVYCNIHPEMAATILVLPNRRFTRAAADGSFRIVGVPPGRWTVYAYSRGAIMPVSTPATVTAGRTTELRLSLEENRSIASHLNKFGEKYREPGKYR